jgi:hypothetical protein
VSELLLLETLVSVGLSEALQDAVAGAIGEDAAIPLAQLKDLLIGAGVGLATAKRVVGRLVSWHIGRPRQCDPKFWQSRTLCGVNCVTDGDYYCCPLQPPGNTNSCGCSWACAHSSAYSWSSS